MRERQSDMLQGSVVKPILLFFFPILFGSLFQQLYNTVDAMVVGNFVGKEALGAVGGATATFIELLFGMIKSAYKPLFILITVISFSLVEGIDLIK